MSENNNFVQLLRVYDNDDPAYVESKKRDVFAQFGDLFSERLRTDCENGVFVPVCFKLTAETNVDYDAFRDMFVTDTRYSLLFLDVKTNNNPPIPIDTLPFIETKRLLRELWKRPFRLLNKKRPFRH